MFIEQPPWFFRALYPQAIFRMDPNERAVYLTFDDGPIPEVTPWVLELLEKHNIKATFFMVGDNIKKHPDEYRMVVEHGHRIGNHTFNHIRGFEYSNPDYLANAQKVDEIIHPTCSARHTATWVSDNTIPSAIITGSSCGTS